eukprot:Hpha_TRINITY_DN16505_c1_g1::TRINITY_DN16505_c1_g1_i2::g.132200::m.132200
MGVKMGDGRLCGAAADDDDNEIYVIPKHARSPERHRVTVRHPECRRRASEADEVKPVRATQCEGGEQEVPTDVQTESKCSEVVERVKLPPRMKSPSLESRLDALRKGVMANKKWLKAVEATPSIAAVHKAAKWVKNRQRGRLQDIADLKGELRFQEENLTTMARGSVVDDAVNLQGGWLTSDGDKVSVLALEVQYVETGHRHPLELGEESLKCLGCRIVSWRQSVHSDKIMQAVWDDGDVWTRAKVPWTGPVPSMPTEPRGRLTNRSSTA